jgi:hypothetical protein
MDGKFAISGSNLKLPTTLSVPNPNNPDEIVQVAANDLRWRVFDAVGQPWNDKQKFVQGWQKTLETLPNETKSAVYKMSKFLPNTPLVLNEVGQLVPTMQTGTTLKTSLSPIKTGGSTPPPNAGTDGETLTLIGKDTVSPKSLVKPLAPGTQVMPPKKNNTLLYIVGGIAAFYFAKQAKLF